MNNKKWLLSLSTSVTMLITAQAVWSQESASGFVIEEVTVTAGKTGVKNVQDLPIAITALGSVDMEEQGVVELSNLAPLTPGFTFTSNSVWAISSIRGIGTNNVFAGGDPSVTIQVDGVYYGRPTGANFDFLDIERVEILRGPQGTLYGRNAIAGTINVITRDPDDEWSGVAKLSVGDYGLIRPEIAVSGPIVDDKLSFSLTGRYSKRDGYIEQLNNRFDDLWDEDRHSARGKLKFTPSDAIAFTLSADYSRNNESFNFATVRITPSADDGTGPDFFEASTDDDNQYDLEQWGGSFKAEWFLDDATVTSITAYRKSDSFLGSDLDFTQLPLFTTRAFVEEQSQLTQEVNVAGDLDNAVSYVAGIFYYHETADSYFNATITDSLLLSQGIDVTTDSVAAFLQGEYPLTEDLTLTAGIRYTYDEKETSNDYGISFALNPALPDGGLGSDPFVSADLVEIFSDKDTYDAWTPKVGLDFQLNDAVLLYGSITRGFKSGGYNLLIDPTSAQRAGYSPEKLWAYEAGLKSTFDVLAPVRFNLAGFYYDYSGLQVNQFIFLASSVAQLVGNAPSALIKGLEAEFTVWPSEHFEMGGTLAYLSSEYDKSFIAVNNLDGSQIDANGKRLSDAPSWSGSAYLQMSTAIGQFEATFRAEATYKSEVFYSPLNSPLLGASSRWLYNVGASFANPESGVTLGVRCENVTDEEYLTGNYFAFSSGGVPGAPRHVVAYLKYDF